MRRLTVALILLLLAPWPSAQSRGPRLAVIIVVDQMRADYVTRFQKDWTGGLKRLVNEGAVFENAAYPYEATVTCAGHATIATGTYPHLHGIIQNAWWERESGAVVTCTQDPRVRGIGYGVAFQGGDSAWREMRPTYSDIMRERGGHIVTLAIKDRSAIMLAGHGGDAVTWLSEALGGWVTSTAFAKEPLPGVAAFASANPITADAGKSWTRMLQPARYVYQDDQPSEAFPAEWTRVFPHVLRTPANAAADPVYITQW